jgi:hypothetical protein
MFVYLNQSRNDLHLGAFTSNMLTHRIQLSLVISLSRWNDLIVKLV